MLLIQDSRVDVSVQDNFVLRAACGHNFPAVVKVIARSLQTHVQAKVTVRRFKR